MKTSYLWLSRHPFVRRLYDREARILQLLAQLVGTLSKKYRDGWVPQSEIYSEMAEALHFGYSRQEQEYWVDQAIYRKVLTIEKRREEHKRSYFLHVTQEEVEPDYLREQLVEPVDGAEKSPQPVASPESGGGEIRVFVSYAREDLVTADDFYQKLTKLGYKPWMDKKDLLGGEKWRESIEMAIKQSDLFLACLTNNSMKEGFIQKEIKIALDIRDEMPENMIFVIPIRLEECYVPEKLEELFCVDLYEPDGWSRLEKSIRHAFQLRKKAL